MYTSSVCIYFTALFQPLGVEVDKTVVLAIFWILLRDNGVQSIGNTDNQRKND